MFKLYLLFIILFLMPICYVVIVEIFKLLTKNYLFNVLISLKKNKKLIKDQVLSLASIYIKNKQWLFCLLMLEFYSKLDPLNIGEYYNTIGFCYQVMNFNQLAKKYYIKALKASPSNVLFLKNLAKINYICKDFQAAIDLYNQILVLDSGNKVALESIDSLSRLV
uniref:hypothetical protein n=1 Tax=Polyopes affinis TaxID=194519 RepID=UPI002A828A20|nr:hypothetical protein NDC12_pgp136 [Polyopes affinis]WOL37000.1 hypothetical protein [Polyopes affinis]